MRELFDGTDTPPEEVEQFIEAEVERAAFEVHPDNWQIVMAFVALQTQWRVVAGGLGRPVYQGLEYASIPAVLRLTGIPRGEHVDAFAALRLMESAALKELNASPGAEQ